MQIINFSEPREWDVASEPGELTVTGHSFQAGQDSVWHACAVRSEMQRAGGLVGGDPPGVMFKGLSLLL